MAVVTIETDHLRTMSEIVRLLKVPKSTVSMWIFRDSSGFPEPALVVGKSKFWDVREVLAWFG